MYIDRDVLMNDHDSWRDIQDYPKDTLFHEMINGKLFVFEASLVNCYYDSSFSGHTFFMLLNKCFWAQHPTEGIKIFKRQFKDLTTRELHFLVDIIKMDVIERTSRAKIIQRLKKTIVFQPNKGKKKRLFLSEYQQYLDDKSGIYMDFNARKATGLIDTDSEDDE